MEGLLMLGLVFVALISLFLSKTLLTYGKSIDQYPVSGQEKREISLWSPMMFTQLSVLAFWPFFLIGSLMVFQQSRFILIGGIALITGLTLYLGTAVVFSIAVFNAMASSGKERNKSDPVPGVMRRVPPFPLKSYTCSRVRPQRKISRTWSPGSRR